MKTTYTMRVDHKPERTTVYAVMRGLDVQIVASNADGTRCVRERELYTQMRERGFGSFIPLVSEMLTHTA